MRLPNISLYISAIFLLSSSASPQNTAHIGRIDSSQYVYTGSVAPSPHPVGAAQTPTGLVQIAVKLSDPPLVAAVGSNAKQNGISMTAAQQRAYLAGISAKQDAIAAQITGLGGTVLGRL